MSPGFQQCHLCQVCPDYPQFLAVMRLQHQQFPADLGYHQFQEYLVLMSPGFLYLRLLLELLDRLGLLD